MSLTRRQFLKGAAATVAVLTLPPLRLGSPRAHRLMIHAHGPRDTRDFPAWGDGYHDDTENIRAAMNYAQRGAVVFDQGTFRITGSGVVIQNSMVHRASTRPVRSCSRLTASPRPS
jgi:hypothetical protein